MSTHTRTATWPWPSAAGYQELLHWARITGQVNRVGVEGAGSYGAGLTRALRAAGVEVVEVNRPNRALRQRRGKTDAVDAEAAARAVLSGEAAVVPKHGDGPVEAIRVLQVVYLDIDSKVKQVYGAAKQGAEHGYTKVKGLHFQIVTASTPLAAPVIVASRLRKGSAGSAKGAAHLIAEAIAQVRAMGATSMIVVRADSAFFSHKVVVVCRRAKARFSLAVAQRKKVRQAIAAIPEDAWDTGQVPQGDLGRYRATLDLGRGGGVHRVHRQGQEVPHEGPAAHPPRQAPQRHPCS
ncbi:transposase [Streptomyces sp. NPDC059718]